MNSKKQLSRRQKAIRDNLTPLFLYLFILANAAAFTWIVSEPVSHPNRHPRLVRFFTDFRRFHPRVCKYGPSTLFVFYVAMLAITPGLGRISDYGLTKARLRASRRTSEGDPSTISAMQPLPLDVRSAWTWLCGNLPGMPLSVPGIRETNWRILQKSETSLTMTVLLPYCHNHVGLNSNQMYPRMLTCIARVTGAGTKCMLCLEYSAQSAMDQATVKALISQTNARLAEAASGLTNIKAMRGIDEQILQHGKAKFELGGKPQSQPIAQSAPVLVAAAVPVPDSTSVAPSAQPDVIPGTVPGYEYFSGT